MKRLYVWLQSRSYKNKLLVYCLLISIFPVSIIGAFSAYTLSNSIQQEVNLNQKVLLKQMEKQLNTYITQLNIDSIRLASNRDVIHMLKDDPPTNDILKYNETIRKTVSFSAVKYNVSLIHLPSNSLYTSGDENFAFYKQILEQEQPNYNSEVIISPKTYHNQSDLIIARPVPLQSYYTDGVVFLSIQSYDLTRMIDQLNLPTYQKLYILDQKNQVLISNNPEEIGEKLTGEFIDRIQTDELYEVHMEQEKYHANALHSQYNEWTLVALTPSDILYKKSNDIKQLTLWIVLSLILCWSVIIVMSSRKMYRPIDRIVRKIQLLHQSQSTRKNEFQTLESFLHHLLKTNSQLQDEWSKQLPNLQENTILQILHGKWTEESKLNKKLTEVQLQLPSQNTPFFIVIVEVDRLKKFQQYYPEKDIPLIQYAFKKITMEVFDVISPIYISPRIGQMVLICTHEQMQLSENSFEKIANRLREAIKSYFPFTVSIVKSETKIGYDSLSKNYEEALSLLRDRLFIQEDVTVTAKQVERMLPNTSRDLYVYQKNIIQNLLKGELEVSIENLNELVNQIPTSMQQTERILSLFAYLLTELDLLLYELKIDLQTLFPESLLDTLYRIETLQEVHEWFEDDVFPTIIRHINNEGTSRHQKIVLQMIVSVEQYYDQDISLQKLADEMQMSSSQLSKIFKQQMNQTFSEYLLNYRMKKATEWLEKTDLSFQAIAQKLMYTNTQNFARAFKKLIGMTPGEYRKKHQA